MNDRNSFRCLDGTVPDEVQRVRSKYKERKGITMQHNGLAGRWGCVSDPKANEEAGDATIF